MFYETGSVISSGNPRAGNGTGLLTSYGRVSTDTQGSTCSGSELKRVIYEIPASRQLWPATAARPGSGLTLTPLCARSGHWLRHAVATAGHLVSVQLTSPVWHAPNWPLVDDVS